MADLGTIFIGAVGLGAGGEMIRRYRAFKARRRETSRDVRNSGFWKDGRLYLAEWVFCAVLAGAPFSAIVLMTSADRPIWVAWIGLVAYAAFILLMMRALNMREPQ